MTQQELADALGIKQPSLSKLEHQADMQISTLKRIVEALGGELRVQARFPRRPTRTERRRARSASRTYRELELV